MQPFSICPDARPPTYRRTLQRALDDAWAGRFAVLIVWALDRITREGAEGALRIIRQFRERGCTVISIKESWLNGSPEVQDVLVAFAGWMAQQESQRLSDRIRAGLARRRAEGWPIGRQPAHPHIIEPGKTDRITPPRQFCVILFQAIQGADSGSLFPCGFRTRTISTHNTNVRTFTLASLITVIAALLRNYLF